MPFSPGTKLGPYEILSPAGAGGMGEVYRARDTRLDRTVAIKVLPSHLSSRPDWPDLRQRFEREAKAISSLNHPHICTLHDIGHQEGIDYLVLEYLEGETLAKRLEKGPLPTEQVLCCGIEIADALDKAHRQGLIHRDLKPGNIMLTKSGVKLMDFGLAKATSMADAGARRAIPLQEMATEGKPLTAQGALVGTLQYMSPEQLEGKEADSRTDLFALGAVLYEMATGKKAFEGKSQASVIAAILERDPQPITAIQPMAPPALERLVKRCLAKDCEDRWQNARDLMAELKWIAEGDSGAAAPSPLHMGAQRARLHRVAWGLAAMMTLLTIAFAVAFFHPARREAHAIRYILSPPEGQAFAASPPAISPDGSRLAYVASSGGKTLLWVRPLDSLAAQALSGTEDASNPFWSPDSRFIAFFAQGRLKKIEVSGGPPQTLCNTPSGFGGTWNQDGVIVFGGGSGLIDVLYRVSATGGVATPLTKLDQSRQEMGHRWPYFLPDGRHFLYVADSARRGNEGSFVIYARSLDSEDARRLLVADSMAAFAGPSDGHAGYLLFVREEALLAQAFDAKTLQITGGPTPVVERVSSHRSSGSALFSVSTDGVLAYRSGSATKTQLVWFDRGGKQAGSIGPPGDYRQPRLSPDEKRLAVDRRDPETREYDIWLLDVLRGTPSRFTFSGNAAVPVWSPDGGRIIFCDGELSNLHQKLSNGSGSDEPVLKSSERKIPTDWSQDGRFIVYESLGEKTRRDLWVLPLFGDRKPFPFLNTEFIEQQGHLSPDGRWIAYASNESGTSQVYVQSFQKSGGKWQISTDGGADPAWRRDGKELFFLAPDKKLMAVDATGGSTFEASVPRVLFQTRVTGLEDARNHYVVAGDGQRFLVNTLVEESTSLPMTVVVNWTADLKK